MPSAESADKRSLLGCVTPGVLDGSASVKTVLVVDDLAIFREPIVAVLAQAGYGTLSASNGADAMSAMAGQIPDLVILDLGMPVMDGVAVLGHMRKSPRLKSVPVIVLSAETDRHRIMEAAKFGLAGYSLKSQFSLADLLQKINCTLESESAAKPEQIQPSLDLSNSMGRNASAVDSAIQSPKPPDTVESGEKLRSLKSVLSRAEVIARVDACGELKGFSAAATEILKLTGNVQCSIDQVATAISRDHAIALKVLKLANSAVYTRGEPVDSVHTAVVRIGLGQIRQAVLNIAVVERFSTGSSQSLIENGQFWEHGMATGIIAAEIAHSRREKDANAAFTMGLLHDIGRMVLVTQLGDAYTKVLQTAAAVELPLELVEERMLFFNHAEIMDRVFRAWKFSKEFINPIVFHHIAPASMPRTAPNETAKVATLALADRLAHALMLGSSGNQTIYATEELCDLLRLDPSVIAEIERIAREETDKVKFALLANSNQSSWKPLRDVHKESLASPFRPLYVSTAPAIDAHRILCDQLSDRNEKEPPNIGIIACRQARDRIPLCERFKSAESASGARSLPLLVISPEGKTMPETSILTGRHVEVLATPFAIGRMVRAVNRLLEDRQRSAKAA